MHVKVNYRHKRLYKTLLLKSVDTAKRILLYLS